MRTIFIQWISNQIKKMLEVNEQQQSYITKHSKNMKKLKKFCEITSNVLVVFFLFLFFVFFCFVFFCFFVFWKEDVVRYQGLLPALELQQMLQSCRHQLFRIKNSESTLFHRNAGFTKNVVTQRMIIVWCEIVVVDEVDVRIVSLIGSIDMLHY